jgi:hypothetical protein
LEHCLSKRKYNYHFNHSNTDTKKFYHYYYDKHDYYNYTFTKPKTNNTTTRKSIILHLHASFNDSLVQSILSLGNHTILIRDNFIHNLDVSSIHSSFTRKFIRIK